MMRSFCICSWAFGVSFSCLRKFQKGQLFFPFSKVMLLRSVLYPFSVQKVCFCPLKGALLQTALRLVCFTFDILPALKTYNVHSVSVLWRC